MAALICGIDEVGRGPWAGPVVAAAVILPAVGVPEGLGDSKAIAKARLPALAAAIREVAEVSIAEASVAEIDAEGIRAATFLAMARAVAGLPKAPARALVDGRDVPPGLPCPGEAVVRGDASVPAISAASIVAKVHRDTLMARLGAEWPGYGWESNAGYGTAAHRAALARLGVTPHHRRSFAPIHKMLCETPRSTR